MKAFTFVTNAFQFVTLWQLSSLYLFNFQSQTYKK